MPKRRQHRCRKWLVRFLLVLTTAWLVITQWQFPTVTGQPQMAEMRGVWMTNLGSALMYYTTRLDETVGKLAQQHLNTVYPAVWNRGYTLHSSQVLQTASGRRRDPLTSLPVLPFQDPVREWVYQAHRQHLRLIPWFEYGLMIPTSSALAQAHPDWLTVNQDGQQVEDPMQPNSLFPKALQNLQLEVTGGNQAWLNPFKPEVRQFLVDLIAEAVQQYEVDGIQLDDHFGLPVAFGYDEETVALYRQEHGGAAPPTDPTNSEWVRWRADKISLLFRDISQAVKATRPEAVVSLSPNPPDFAYRNYLQDWRRWVDEGWVDEVVVQVYRDSAETLSASLEGSGLAAIAPSIPLSIGLYTGPFLDATPMETIQQQVEVVRSAGYNGVSFFSWETTFWLFRHESVNEEIWRSLFPQR
ncbi:glycoside hydrolase family 10 protein [Vacuolonema iberomarrocanum]|uniref:glycoside hydrolase family 10 protein n=1 Tax=Vacuolonema iberomarrocanum TaxID=3454632 RepID=UPI0019DB5A78|nr:family 10 glycosylhydrolase [filamentous cyanobacterium LEGE 07170]